MPPAKRKAAKEKLALEEWASLLAKKTAEPSLSAKDERVAKRAAKKRRREERLTTKAHDHKLQDTVRKSDGASFGMDEQKLLLNGMSKTIKHCVSSEDAPKRRPLFTFSSSTKARNVKKSWQEDTIQPRKKDYGGIGLARPSLYIDFNDPSLVPKLESEFAEHIPGFFGKQRTKAMKKQLGGKMLWRKLSDSKTKEKIVNGKRLKDMSPDERVEAMIKIGML
jgi:hypothetical protein